MIWGIGYFLRKIALTSVDPTVLTAYSYLVVAIAFLGVPEVRTDGYATFRQNPWLYSLLGICGVLASWVFSYGLAHLPLSIATLFEKIQPVFVLLLARLFLGERFPLAKIPSGMVAIAAAYALVVENPFRAQLDSHTTIAGLLAVTVAALCWALAGVVGKTAITISSSSLVAAIRIYVGLVIIIPATIGRAWVGGWSILFISPADFWLIFIAAITSTMVGYVLFYRGLETTHVGIASFIELITPMSSVALGLIFLGEHLDLWHQGYAVMLLGAVLMVSRTVPADQESPSALADPSALSTPPQSPPSS